MYAAHASHASPLQSPPCRSLSSSTEPTPAALQQLEQQDRKKACCHQPATLALPLSAHCHQAATLALPPSAQAAYAQAAGAAAVLVVNDDDTGFFRMGQEPAYTGAAVAVPVCGMSQVQRTQHQLSTEQRCMRSGS